MKRLQPKVFASRGTDEDFLYNLQLVFWDLAVEKFRGIQQKAKKSGVCAGHNPDNYFDEDFLEDACVVIVLLGTSLTQLLGMQDKFKGVPEDKLPEPYQLLCQLTSRISVENQDVIRSTKKRFEKLVTVYNRIRHFGLAHEATARNITYASLCGFMNTGRDVWIVVKQITERQGKPFANTELPKFLNGDFENET